jgi:hypothetical protein
LKPNNLTERKSKFINTIANIGYGNICPREENLFIFFFNENIGSYLSYCTWHVSGIISNRYAQSQNTGWKVK